MVFTNIIDNRHTAFVKKSLIIKFVHCDVISRYIHHVDFTENILPEFEEISMKVQAWIQLLFLSTLLVTSEMCMVSVIHTNKLHILGHEQLLWTKVYSRHSTSCGLAFGYFNTVTIVRNHVKLLHVYKSRRGFSKGTVLYGGY